MSFLSELKRRNVFRVGAAYAIVAWLLIQIADTLLPTFGAPEWVTPVFSSLVILGLPLALILAWAFEMTPEGIKPTHAVDPNESVTGQTGQKLNNLISVGLLVLLIFVSVDQYILEEQESLESTIAEESEITDEPEVTNSAEQAIIPAENKSIAVLPLDDFGAGGEDAYFADGLTEEILNALTRTPDLLVASRTSSFQYKGQLVDIQEVAEELGVSYVLEGSVRRSSTRLRVTVQLIRAADGFPLWSETYDRQPEDIIEVQEDIAFRIATTLQTAMDPEALRQMVQTGTRSITAYNTYLQGLALLAETEGFPREVYELFEEARAEDPGFAAAHVRASLFWTLELQPALVRPDYIQEDRSFDESRSFFNERIRLAISNSTGPEQFRYRALEAYVNLNYRSAYDFARQYFEERPNIITADIDDIFIVRLAYYLGDTENALAYLDKILGMVNTPTHAMFIMTNYWGIHQFERGHSYVRQAIDRFPFDNRLIYQGHRLLLWGGYYDEARQLMANHNGTDDSGGDPRLMQLRQYCADQDLDNANRVYGDLMSDDNLNIPRRWLAMNIMGHVEEAADLLRPLDLENTLYPLASFMTYPNFDITQYPNLQDVMAREGVSITYEPIPFACNR